VKNQIISCLCKILLPPFVKLAVCHIVFSDFYSIAARRSLCTTLVTVYCGHHQRCHSWKKDAKKQIYLFFSSFFHEQMLRICPQYAVSSLVVHSVPLRGGS